MPTHTVIDPAVLYFGTPVALLSTVDRDGATNTSPMSSVFWLGQTSFLGMGARSLTAQNLNDEVGHVRVAGQQQNGGRDLAEQPHGVGDDDDRFAIQSVSPYLGRQSKKRGWDELCSGD